MEKIKKILKNIKHPEINASLIELGMIKDVEFKDGIVVVTMLFPFPGVPIRNMLIEAVKEPIEKEGLKVEIKEGVMNEKELQKFFKMEQEKWKGF